MATIHDAIRQVPNSPIRDAEGRMGLLRDKILGGNFVLLYIQRPQSPKSLALVRQFCQIPLRHTNVRKAILVPEQNADRFISLDAPDCSVLRFEQPLREFTFSGAKSLASLGFVNARMQIKAIRQLDVLRETELIRWIETQRPSGPKSQGNLLHDTAPVLIVPDVLNSPSCARLISYFDQEGGQPSGVLDLSGSAPRWQPDPDIKIRRDLLVERPELIQEIEMGLAQVVLPEIRKCFHYIVTHHEPFKLVCYDSTSGGYFRPHRDNETQDTTYRRFAMTLNLNTGEYQGGGLRFPEYSENVYQAPKGGAIVFSCSLLHEALDVTEGRRYAVLAFFYNPQDTLPK